MIPDKGKTTNDNEEDDKREELAVGKLAEHLRMKRLEGNYTQRQTLVGVGVLGLMSVPRP